MIWRSSWPFVHGTLFQMWYYPIQDTGLYKDNFEARKWTVVDNSILKRYSLLNCLYRVSIFFWINDNWFIHKYDQWAFCEKWGGRDHLPNPPLRGGLILANCGARRGCHLISRSNELSASSTTFWQKIWDVWIDMQWNEWVSDILDNFDVKPVVCNCSYMSTAFLWKEKLMQFYFKILSQHPSLCNSYKYSTSTKCLRKLRG